MFILHSHEILDLQSRPLPLPENEPFEIDPG
jgi:hypothetical protein